MKTIKLFLTAGLLALVTSASAQFANATAGGSGTTKAKSQMVKDTENYSRVSVSYNPLKVKFDVEGASDVKMNGFSAGYTYGLNILKTAPLFVEFGANVMYASGKDSESDGDYWSYEQKYNTLALNVPVSLSYKFSFADKMSLSPFVGVNFRGVLLASGEYTETYDGESNSMDMNYFDEDEVGEDGKWKRVQVGWQIGVGFNYKKLYVGVAYGSDLSEITKKAKLSFTTISLGYNF